MIALTGTSSILIAMILTIIQIILPKKAPTLTHFISTFTLLSLGTLIYAYIVSDFSILNVALNSHTAKPLIYKISGAWGNHEGSMLLFVCFITLYTSLFALKENASDFKNIVIKIQSLIIFMFLCYVFFASNPFVLLQNPPANGQGLNPLLQDIGLAMHPPMLYLGYCGFSLALSFAVAALLQGKMQKNWSKSLRPWIKVSWGFLTAGIGLGSWWAYRELGWGGYWFWDPVENSSLLPWLSATALIHSVAVSEKRSAFKCWTALLAILTFSFGLTGFFLVRSGILTSVHSFATDPARGAFILLLMVIIIGGSLALYAIRSHRLNSSIQIKLISKEFFLLLNNILLITLCGTVLLGTVYPIILEVIGDTRVSVGTPYYEKTFMPIAVIALILAAFAPLIRWKEDGWQRVVTKSRSIIIISILFSIVVSYFYNSNFILVFASVLLLFSSLSLIIDKRKKSLDMNKFSMEIGHLGIGLLAISIVSVTSMSDETIIVAQKGVPFEFSGFSVEYNGAKLTTGKNYIGSRGEFFIHNDRGAYPPLYPENRLYPVERNNTTESAILTTYLSDLYLVMGDRESEDSVVVRAFYRPMINGIWLGCFIVALSGFLHLYAKKRLK